MTAFTTNSTRRSFSILLVCLTFILAVRCDDNLNATQIATLVQNGLFEITAQYPSGTILQNNVFSTIEMSDISTPPIIRMQYLENRVTSSTKYLAFLAVKDTSGNSSVDSVHNIVWLQTEMTAGEVQSTGTTLVNTTAPYFPYSFSALEGSTFNGFSFDQTMFDLFLEVWEQTDPLMNYLFDFNEGIPAATRPIKNLWSAWVDSNYGARNLTLPTGSSSILRGIRDFNALGYPTKSSSSASSSTAAASGSSKTSTNSASHALGDHGLLRIGGYTILALLLAWIC